MEFIAFICIVAIFSIPVLLVLGPIAMVMERITNAIFSRFFTEVVEEGEDGERICYWVI